MKKLFFFIVLSFGINLVNAQNFELTGQNMIRSKYVGPHDGVIFYNKPVNQGNVTLFHIKTGLFVDLWYSTGFNLDPQNWDDEIDYSIGWRGEILEFNLYMSLTYFDNHTIFDFPFNDVIHFYGKISVPKLEITNNSSISPFVSYSKFWIPDKNTPFNGGEIKSIGFDGNINFSKKINGGISPLFAWDSGTFGVEKGWLFKLGSNVDWQLNNHLTWNILEYNLYYIPLKTSSIRRGLPNQHVWGSGLVWKI